MQRVWTTATAIAHTGILPTHFFVPAVSAYIWQLWSLGRQFWKSGTCSNYLSTKPLPLKNWKHNLVQENQRKNTFSSDFLKLLIAAQGGPYIEVDLMLQMCSRSDVQTKDKKENLNGIWRSTHGISRVQRHETSNHFHVVRILQVSNWTSEVPKDFDTPFILFLIAVNRRWSLGGNVGIQSFLITHSPPWNSKFFLGSMLEGDHWVSMKCKGSCFWKTYRLLLFHPQICGCMCLWRMCFHKCTCKGDKTTCIQYIICLVHLINFKLFILNFRDTLTIFLNFLCFLPRVLENLLQA